MRVWRLTAKHSPLAAFLLSVLMITGCEVKQPPAPDETLNEVLPESTIVDTDFKEIANAATGKVQSGWLKNFDDPRLEALVREAIENNLDLRAAANSIEISQALATQAGAELKPVVNAGGKLGNAETFGSGSLALDQSAIVLNAEWELDIWGRVRSQSAAGLAALEATRFQVEWAYQSVAAQTARIYFLLTEASLQLGLAKEALDLYKRTQGVVEAKHKTGQVTQREVSLAKANVASGEATIRSAMAALQQASRAMEVILGRYPSAEVEGALTLNAKLPKIPVGLPSDLLERRPDVRAAERAIAAQYYQIQTAEAARLPKISLTAALGSTSNDLSNIISLGNDYWSVGANFAAPIFNAGALEAQVDIESAEYKQAMANYGKAALTAFSEVEQGLANETLLREQQSFLEQVVVESAEALRVANVQFDVGKVDLLSVIQQQGQLIGAKVNMLSIKSTRLQQRVALHLALGGGFDESPALSPEQATGQGETTAL